jgi:dienelactone hydrolase
MNMNGFNIFAYLRLYLVIGAILPTVLLGGCSSSAKQPKIDQTKVQQFAARGYDSGIEYATSTTRLSPNIGNECCEITLVQPGREGKYPLIIYLPGLGESSDAGADMRNAWAKSGYAVLSFQALKDDESVWSSKAARNADFAYIRHERYSAGIISERLNILTKLIGYLKQGIASGDAGLQRMDLSHIAIVGFDIGASSAMIIAGEDFPSVSNTDLPIHVDGVIALSPYADFSGSALDVRYRDINVPVLSITGDADGDAHGGVPPSLHQAPFQYMPPGNKYLLLLAGASHSVIGNEDSAKSAPTEGEGNSQQTDSGNTSGSSSSGSGKRHGKRTSNSGSPSTREGGSSPTERAIMEVAIAQVTTAFLNAYIKNDKFSLDWLKKDAQPWLNKIGQLKEK